MTGAVLDELRWRGVLAQTTDEAALRAALDAGPVTFYVGFDPTAPSLHIGNLVQLVTARRLQRAGHRPLLLVGGSTGLVGDPKAAGERVMNDPSVVAGWVERITEQVRPFVSFEGPSAARLVNNLDWTAPMSALELLRDVGRHFRVGRMLAKDAVAARMTSAEGISYTEFSYQVLQALDYLELHRRHGCVLQTGGSDQWGNITAGVDLVHRAEGASVHALSTQLITKPDGTKFGKSEGGAIWLSAELMSPYAFYQSWLAAEDAVVDWYLRVFTDRGREELEALAAETAQRPQARSAQRALAQDVTTLVHGAAAAARAEAASAALFGRGDLAALDAATLRAALAELPVVRAGEGEPLTVPHLLAAAGVVPSASAGRRAVAEGGAYVNNTRWDDVDRALSSADALHGRWVVLRRGRRSLAAVDLAPGAAGPGQGPSPAQDPGV